MIHQHVEFPVIQSDCNKKLINFIFDVTTKTNWKGTIEKKNAKNANLQFWPNPVRMFIKPSGDIITEN